MSNYKHLFAELPLKCEAILNDCLKEDIRQDREITHMLVLASISLMIPLERLDYKHPLKEYDSYPTSFDAMKELLKGSFVSTSSHKANSYLYRPNTWFYDQWLGDARLYENYLHEPKPMETYCERFNNECRTEQFLRHLRNALAHGNVFFSGDHEIERLGFVSKKDKDKKLIEEFKQKCIPVLKDSHDVEVAVILTVRPTINEQNSRTP